MAHDNMMFNVNGSDKEQLLKALKLVFEIRGVRCRSWVYSEQSGLILCWTYDPSIPSINANFPLPTAMDAESCVDFVWDWLSSPEAAKVKLDRWEKDLDHDGDNYAGWRVYVDDYGYIYDKKEPMSQYAPGGNYAICAIKPCYLWYGK